jgi:hypothetical protein
MQQTNSEYIKNKLIENNLSIDSLCNREEYKKFLEATGSNCNYSSYKRRLYENYEEIVITSVENEGVISENIVKLQANKQALQDKNTVVNKINREQNRLYNHLRELYQGYIDIMSNNKLDLNKFKLKSEKIKNNKNWGIIHFSDFHANKKIEKKENVNNEYNFTIMSRRLKKFVSEAIFHFKSNNVENVFVMMTGDLISSDYRMNQKLNRVTNQIKASLLTTYILQQAIMELNQYFGLKIACVIGNEARVQDDELYSDELLASNNYDYLIYNNLRLWLKDTNIEFDTSGSPIEKCQKLGNFNLIMLHGHTLSNSRDMSKGVKDVLTKYAVKGIQVHGIFSGHVHSCIIGDIFSRSSSMIGEDSYSSNDLHVFDGRPSQNIYIINSDNSYTGIKIDLVDISTYIGYDVKSELEVYYIEENSIMYPNTEVIIRNLV